MGIFKNVKDMADVVKQAKDVGDAEMERKGMRKGLFGAPHLGDSLQQMKSALGDVAEMQANAALLQTGAPGAAKVLSLTDTGMEVNMNRVVEMQLEVSVEGADAYTTTHREAISPMLMPQIQPGGTVPVRIDTEDRDRLVLDWARVGQV